MTILLKTRPQSRSTDRGAAGPTNPVKLARRRMEGQGRAGQDRAGQGETRQASWDGPKRPRQDRAGQSRPGQDRVNQRSFFEIFLIH